MIVPFLLFGLCAATLIGGLFLDTIPITVTRIVGLVYFLGTGASIARNLTGFPWVCSALCAPLVNLVLLGGIGGVIYFFLTLTAPVIVFLIGLPLAAVLLTSRVCSTHPPIETPSVPIQPKLLLLVFLYLSFIISFFGALFFLQTTDAVLGPWDGVMPEVFILFFFSSFLLVALHWIGIPPFTSLALLTIHTTASLSVALIRFPLAFGFDPIIHHAAEKLVLEQGAVTPKTFYYLAQYVVVPFFARIFDVSVSVIHQPLTVIVLGLSIPVFLLFALRCFFFNNPRSVGVLALFFLLIPFPYLVMTTPWGLAYGITLLTVLSSGIALLREDRRFWIISGFLVLAALLLHPLAGIPLMIFLLLVRVRDRLFQGIAFFLGCISIPFAFWLNTLVSSQSPLSIHIPSLADSIRLFDNGLALATRFSPLLDGAYFFNRTGFLFFAALMVVGIFLVFQRSMEPIAVKRRQFARSCLLTAFSITMTAVLTRTMIRFDTLAGFEQQDYTRRLFDSAMLFLLPLAAIGLEALIAHIRKNQNGLMPVAFALLSAGFLTSSLYLSYPRNDAYVPSHAYTLSQTDINVVRAIDADAEGRDYAVLSNQVVASAAIREFGFKHYFTVSPYGQVFYYPVPSGSPLAEQYAAMLMRPSRDTALRAMTLVSVDRIYFVVRDYEFRFPIIVRDAKTTADEWREIDGGKAYVFVYKK